MIDYECKTCNYKFKTNSNLVRHLKKKKKCIKIETVLTETVQNQAIDNIKKIIPISMNTVEISIYIDQLYNNFASTFLNKSINSQYNRIYHNNLLDKNICEWLLDEIVITFIKNKNIDNRISATKVKTILGYITHMTHNILNKIEEYYKISVLIQNCTNINYLKIDEYTKLEQIKNLGEYSFIIELCDIVNYNDNAVYFSSNIDKAFYMKKGDILIYPSTLNNIFLPIIKGENYIIHGTISIDKNYLYV